jgi:hypothetical protein
MSGCASAAPSNSSESTRISFPKTNDPLRDVEISEVAAQFRKTLYGKTASAARHRFGTGHAEHLYLFHDFVPAARPQWPTCPSPSWIARIMVSWGIVSGLMAITWNGTSFITLRFLLGFAEAGFAPGILLYLTYWFPAEHRARTLAAFLIAIPLSTITQVGSRRRRGPSCRRGSITSTRYTNRRIIRHSGGLYATHT